MSEQKLCDNCLSGEDVRQVCGGNLCKGCVELSSLIDDVALEAKCEQIVEDWMANKQISNRGHQWLDFGDAVLNHVERYTVPQYGDMPDDQAQQFSVEDIKANLTRYVNRIGKGVRGQEEALRDCKKIAHYACLLDDKLKGE